MRIKVNVEDVDFWRPSQCGATREMANKGISSAAVKLIGSQKKKEATMGSLPGLP